MLLVDRLQLFTRLEAHGLAGRNADLSAGPRIAPDAGLARAHIEHAEAAQFDAVALSQGALHALKDRLHRLLGFCLGDAGLSHNFVDDIELDHWIFWLRNPNLRILKEICAIVNSVSETLIWGVFLIFPSTKESDGHQERQMDPAHGAGARHDQSVHRKADAGRGGFL